MLQLARIALDAIAAEDRGVIAVGMADTEAPLPVAWQSAGGRSRLYHGDSLLLLAHLSPTSVDCIWTDPPYNLSNDGVTCVAGRMVTVNKGEWDRSRGVERVA
jgi:16S rRNA G966 N2-methylase RsmD